MHASSPPRDPVAVTAAFLAGVLCIFALSLALERAVHRVEPAVERAAPLAEDITHWSARELRTLPGVGEKRAVAIVRERWAGNISGSVDSLDRVPGIGPETVINVRASFVRRPLPPPSRPSVIEP